MKKDKEDNPGDETKENRNKGSQLSMVAFLSSLLPLMKGLFLVTKYTCKYKI